MEIRKMALALPLAVGLACSTSKSTRTASAPEPAPPPSSTASTEGSPGTMGSDAQGGEVATTPAETGTYGTATRDDGTLTGERTTDLKGHASDQVLMGRVASISDRSLSIESDMGSSRTLQVVPETIITVDGREGSLADIREGQQIRASFNEQEGRQVAVKIEAGQTSMHGDMEGGMHGDPHHGDMGTSGTGAGADPSTSPGTGSGAESLPQPDTSTGSTGTDSGYDPDTRR